MKTTLKHKLAIAVVNVARLLLSVTFLFSGVVKLIDPRGTQYKIEDYGAAFGMAAFLPDGMPLTLSCTLAVTEFLVGIYLLYGIRRRMAASLALCFMLVMTPLTLYLAIANPVTDCGCFGDALVLTNWQTFQKNVVLLACSIIVLRYNSLILRFVTRRNQWMVALYSLVFACIFMAYNLWQLPVIDFRPYHVGADVRQAWQDDRHNSGQFVTTFILEKDGIQKEFTLENYPDSTWTFVDSHTVQHQTAKQSGVGDLLIQDAQSGEDITEQILNDTTYNFLLVAPYLEKADDGVMGELLSLYDFSQENGYGFYCLTSSSEQAIENWKEMTGAEYPFCLADAVVLKTIVRSNPGLILLHDGKIVGKWASAALPEPAELNNLPAENINSQSRRVAGILGWYILPLLVFLLIDAVSVARNKKKHSKK